MNNSFWVLPNLNWTIYQSTNRSHVFCTRYGMFISKSSQKLSCLLPSRHLLDTQFDTFDGLLKAFLNHLMLLSVLSLLLELQPRYTMLQWCFAFQWFILQTNQNFTAENISSLLHYFHQNARLLLPWYQLMTPQRKKSETYYGYSTYTIFMIKLVSLYWSTFVHWILGPNSLFS